jgi:hypothetical protein
MADEKLTHIVGCLSEVYPLFVSQLIAEETAKAAAVLEAVTDPIGALLDKNVDALIADMTSLASGDPMANLVRAGLGLFWQEKGRDMLKDSLNDIFDANPSLRKDLAFAESAISKILSLCHLFISLSAEAPYAIAQLALRSMQPFLDQKQRNLGCLRKHIVLLNNALLAIGLDPLKVNDETATMVEDFLSELTDAQIDVRDVQRSLQGVGGFLTNRFASARSHLDKADAIISPEDGGTSLFDVLVASTKAAAGVEFTTLASRRLAIMTAHIMSDLIDVEMAAVKANTRAINLIVAAVKAITSDLANVQQSAKVRDLRLRLLKRFDLELTSLIVQVTTAVNENDDGVDSSKVGLLAIPWTAMVRSLRIQAMKIANADLSQASATGTRIDFLKEALLFAQVGLSPDFPPDIIQGIENTEPLEAKIHILRSTAAVMFKHVEAVKDPARIATEQANIEAQLASLPPIVNATLARISDSQAATDIIGAAADEYIAVDIPITEDLSQITDIMSSLGMSRAVDLLRAGKIKDLMDINDASKASYAGVVLECLLQSARDAPDRDTADFIGDLASKVQVNYINKLVAASDFLSGSGIDFVNQIRFNIEEIQRTTATVRDIIARLKELGVDVAEAQAQINANLAGIDAAQAGNTINSGSALDIIKRQLTTAGFGPPGCDHP